MDNATHKTVEKKNSIQNGIKRAAFAAIAILVQIVWIYLIYFRLSERFAWISAAIHLLAILLVLNIYGSHTTSAMKTPWIVLILTFPMFGVFLYLMLGLNRGSRAMRTRYEKLDSELFPLLSDGNSVLDNLCVENLGVANQCRYIQAYSSYPVCRNTDVIFYPDGAQGFAAQLEELKKARSFIFMEYHAIEDAESFQALHSVLKERVKAGVEVRLFYDYVGSMGFVGNSFAKRMEQDGIQCRVFNPMNPVMNFFLNNRDHRKITVIDGKIGFTGGYNLADEYFHLTEPYGHWLDTGVRLEGDAVKSLTITFLENWNAISGSDTDDSDYSKYLPEFTYHAQENGYIQPYADNPLDDEQVGENVYINVLRNAKRYAWFTTPYLIITDEMNAAFAMAAKSGVDVRIITPGIPDKKLIYDVTRSYYAGLARNGVRIYEYTPGFCHAKQCVSDDEVATCGTINLDFRSLYHHFENGVFMYNYKAVSDIKQQFEASFPLCREVTEEYKSGRSAALRLKQLILRFFAPLM